MEFILLIQATNRDNIHIVKLKYLWIRDGETLEIIKKHQNEVTKASGRKCIHKIKGHPMSWDMKKPDDDIIDYILHAMKDLIIISFQLCIIIKYIISFQLHIIKYKKINDNKNKIQRRMKTLFYI